MSTANTLRQAAQMSRFKCCFQLYMSAMICLSASFLMLAYSITLPSLILMTFGAVCAMAACEIYEQK